jgi:hypothetical protein
MKWLLRTWCIMILVVSYPSSGWAVDQGKFRSLDEQAENLKQEVISINSELLKLEEELLFPVNTQTFFFFSMQGDGPFKPDSIKLSVDGKEVSNYLYSDREVDALARGGVQKLHVENLAKGEHELVAIVIGKGPQGHDVRRGVKMKFKKDLDPKYLELKIIRSKQNTQPEITVKEW